MVLSAPNSPPPTPPNPCNRATPAFSRPSFAAYRKNTKKVEVLKLLRLNQHLQSTLGWTTCLEVVASPVRPMARSTVSNSSLTSWFLHRKIRQVCGEERASLLCLKHGQPSTDKRVRDPSGAILKAARIEYHIPYTPPESSGGLGWSSSPCFQTALTLVSAFWFVSRAGVLNSFLNLDRKQKREEGRESQGKRERERDRWNVAPGLVSPPQSTQIIPSLSGHGGWGRGLRTFFFLTILKCKRAAPLENCLGGLCRKQNLHGI